MKKPAPFQLRGYQRSLIEAVRDELRRHRRVVLQSPTGSGKTVITAHMIRTAAERGMGSWFIVHRKELLEQTSAALWASGVQHGVIAGGKLSTKDRVQVATIQTLARRYQDLTPPNFVMIDEAHHTAAKSYRNVVAHCSRSWIVGLTATPCRTDGRGLDDLFEGLVEGPSVAWLTEQGFLAPYRLVAPPQAMELQGVRTRGGDFERGALSAAVDTSAVVGDAVEHYRRHVLAGAVGRPPSCLVYCVSRKHARHVTEVYREAGVDARYVAGDTPKAERDAAIRGFRHGRPPVIVSVDLFGEGLDVPGLLAVQLLRPTQSLSLHLQQVGRALRPEPGKVALILDHVGNTWRHGLPDDEREWGLEGTRKRKKPTETGPALLHCEECFAIYRATLSACPACGTAPQRAARSQLPDEVEGELQEIDPAEHRRRRKAEEAQARGLPALVELAKERGYKKGWVVHRHVARTRQPFGQVMKEVTALWKEAS